MSKSQVKPIPDGMHTVTPHLVCAGAADAIEFYKKAFNAEELGKVPGPEGKLLHALIRIGDSPVMLVDEFPNHNALGPKSLKGSPVTIHLYVKDAQCCRKYPTVHSSLWTCRHVPKLCWPMSLPLKA